MTLANGRIVKAFQEPWCFNLLQNGTFLSFVFLKRIYQIGYIIIIQLGREILLPFSNGE